MAHRGRRPHRVDTTETARGRFRTLPRMTAMERLANRDLDVASVLPASRMPDRARVVIVGGGIIGASIAYHLTRAGERDVVLLERGRLTNGTTWHAAGLVSRVRGTHALTALTRDNAATYERLDGRDRHRHGPSACRRADDRPDRGADAGDPAGVGMARDFDIPVEVTDRARIRELWPSATVDDLVGGVLFPTDGTSTRAMRRSRSPRARWTAASATSRTPR